MSNTRVERLRYYNGEYLQSFDFTAEQAYHMEMRRRVNLLLHLNGVAYGLELAEDEDSLPPDAPLFAITKGMAIDQIGREIVVDNPYALRTETVLKRKGITAGKNELWICYREDPAGLPAAGYELCNDPGQNTRITESFDVVLVPIPKPAPVKGAENADPDTGRKGVRLGTVDVENDPGGGLRIGTVYNENRVYAGIRAQRVINPDQTADAFLVTAKNESSDGGPLPGYLDVKTPAFLRGNLMAHKNMVIGPDFEVNSADAFNSLPPDFTDPGDLKIANYLVLQKGLIAKVKGKWYLLDEYLGTKMPEFIVDSATIDVDVNNTPPSPINKASSLPFVSNAKVMVMLNGIVWKGKTALDTWWNTLNGTDPLQIRVSGIATRSSDTAFDLNFSYTVGPKDNPVNPADSIVNVDKLIINYMVVFYP